MWLCSDLTQQLGIPQTPLNKLFKKKKKNCLGLHCIQNATACGTCWGGSGCRQNGSGGRRGVREGGGSGVDGSGDGGG
jgi:hypothetical protein